MAIGGPLAILAVLFPSLFGKPKEIMQRYLALLTVMSVNSIAYIVHMAVQTWGGETLRGGWWASPLALWIFMAVVTLLGTVWVLAALPGDGQHRPDRWPGPQERRSDRL